MVVSTTEVQDVRCFIQFGRSETYVEDSESAGLRRVTKVIPTSFHFTQNVKLKVQDIVTYTDDTGVVHNFVVTGYNSASKLHSYWIAFAEETV